MLVAPVMESASNEDVHWWALYTRHQHEKVVAEILCAKGFEVFLPLYESIRRWKDRQKVLSLPVFPCYVFVRGGLNRRLQVVTTPGVYTILNHGERVAVIPEAEIDAIRRTMDARFHMEPHPYIRCGDRVRVMRGSLQGLEGILVRKKNQFRLVLSVDMLAKSVAVEIDATDVEPVTKRVQEDQYPGVFAPPAIVAASHSPVSPVGLRVN
ncbi:MAG TPA: UpxY family transcription antiterminator [Edaphobacter sp.]|nr:UpxY family transcription antiterminator [Edaphobacter sp.]